MEYIYQFGQIDKEDLEIAGGKGANLGEMVKVGLSVPAGFVISTAAYFDFLEQSELKPKIKEILTQINPNNPEDFSAASGKIKAEFEKRQISKDLTQQILTAYHKFGKNKYVAVRSSATAEDLPTASFAGQQASFLNVRGDRELVEKVKSCWASLFEARAIFYRTQNNFDHLTSQLAVVVEVMIQSEVSGVMFTVDPVTGDKSKIIIEAGWGLGELIVQGSINPDHYEVDKDTLRIEKKQIARQDKQLVKIDSQTRSIKVAEKWAKQQKLSDEKIAKLAKLGLKIEKHYFFPQDIEWAVENEKIYIVQTRPVTALAGKEAAKSQSGILQPSTLNLKPILKGAAASPGVASGPVRIIFKAGQIGKIKKGDVLTAPITNPDYVPAMKKAAAVVTDAGGRTSHTAIVSRELGIPAVVGTGAATKVLKSNQQVTVDGSAGYVYTGSVKLTSKTLDYQTKISKAASLQTATKIYVNLADPEQAAEVAAQPVDGVGLLRAEFMIADIGVHPKKVIADGKEKFFINKLAEGLLTIASAFYPRPVVYRATDFKTNEYRNLKGGEAFEPAEANPLLGFRGAIRYLVQPEVFNLELEALKKARSLGLTNLKLMIPFVRTPAELAKIKQIVDVAKLNRVGDFALWMMIEVPSNVILLEEFLACGIDGVSVGSNDLTMLVLGVDRDNEEVASDFDERNEAVLWALQRTIKICAKVGVTSSICGQAPSNFEELTKKLVRWGINSISVPADAVERTRQIVADVEHQLVGHLSDGQVERLEYGPN